MGSARDCLRCAGDACVKCARLIVLGSRTCVDACPSGYREEWSALVDYMGRVCRETSYMGLPGRTLAVIVGACSGAVICVGVLLGGVLPVLKDLARILLLLNRSEENILTPPADWNTLFAWGERVLRRYKKQNPHQVAQAHPYSNKSIFSVYKYRARNK
ncbi:Protein of unknown function [Gryllus bimaculatus]|nr:Protein of unknown function [Gryllus bimaculatus]